MIQFSFFIKNNIPCLYGVDTRYLTKNWQIKGAMKVALINFGDKRIIIRCLKRRNKNWSGLENLDLAKLFQQKNYNWA